MLNNGDIINDVLRIEGRLGEGGLSNIYKAYHLRLKQYVALKIIKDDFAGLSEDKKRLDVDILKNLRHSGLPRVYDIFDRDGNTYTVMDYIDGKNLKQVLEERTTLTRREIISWGIALCDALHVLHTQKKPIIHCDIKPDNVMLGSDGQIVLIDFNISTIFGAGDAVMGMTHGYAPPEQYTSAMQAAADYDDTYATALEESAPAPKKNANAAVVDARTDIYAVGATMFYLLTGTKPLKSTDRLNNPHDLFPDEDSSEIDGLKVVIEKAMALSPRKRYASVASMADDLKNIGRLDPKVKLLQFRREAVSIACLIIMTLSAFSAVYGYLMLRSNAIDAFNMYIGNCYTDMGDSKYDTALENAQSAVELYPHNPTAVLLYAASVRQAASLNDCLAYLTEALPKVDIRAGDGDLARLHYFTGSVYFEVGDYFNAANNFRKAIERDETKPEYYRDYIIALARDGHIEDATAAASDAREKGIDADSLLLANAQINYNAGRYEEAEKHFLEIISKAKLDDVYFTAVSELGTIYLNPRIILDNKIDKAVAMLEGSVADVKSVEDRIIVQELLGMAYLEAALNAGRSTPEGIQYMENALACFHYIESAGFANLYTWLISSRLYQYMGNYDSAKTMLENMIQKYPDDYRAYMRLSYLHIDIENKNDSPQKFYDETLRYYAEAEKRYDPALNSDKEMMTLQRIVERFKEDIQRTGSEEGGNSL